MADSLDVSPCQAENVPNFLLRPDVRGTKPAAEGIRVLICRHYGLPFEQRGKLIVATNDLELERLGALFARCVKSGLDPERLDGRQLSEREPRIIGKGAIFVQSSSITDYPPSRGPW
jgi:L-2-hydroxyglutarate oxidase LhgO